MSASHARSLGPDSPDAMPQERQPHARPARPARSHRHCAPPAGWLLGLWLLGLALTASSLAHAKDGNPTSAAQCRDEPDAQRRLACYDAVFGSPTTRPAATLATPPASASTPPAARPTGAGSQVVTTPLSDRWDLDGQANTLFAPRPYRPVYLLPISWASSANQTPQSPNPENQLFTPLGVQRHEAKYQLSLKAKLAERLFDTPLSIWGAYTQSSRWQIYNGDLSRPFRETNYEPEVIAIWPMNTQLLGWRLRYASLALNHQSNGRALPLSRSWNRVIGGLGVERGDWVAEWRPWVRIAEPRASDDNPDITDYLGRSELRVTRYWGDHAWILQLRHSLRGGERSHGSVQMEWAFPIAGVLHGYLQLFHGHGESLIDYNQRQSRLGLGVSIAGWR